MRRLLILAALVLTVCACQSTAGIEAGVWLHVSEITEDIACGAVTRDGQPIGRACVQALGAVLGTDERLDTMERRGLCLTDHECELAYPPAPSTEH